MVDAEVGEQLLRRGVPAMEPGLAVRALREAVADGDTTLVVADIRWDRFVPAYCAHGHRPLIDDVPEVRDLLARRHEEEAAGQDDTTAADGLRGELAVLPPPSGGAAWSIWSAPTSPRCWAPATASARARRSGTWASTR